MSVSLQLFTERLVSHQNFPPKKVQPAPPPETKPAVQLHLSSRPPSIWLHRDLPPISFSPLIPSVTNTALDDLTSWSCSPPFASTSSGSSHQSDPPALDPHHLSYSQCSTENDSIIPYGMPYLIPSLSSSWQFNWILIYSSSQFKESSSNPSTCVQSKHHLYLPSVNPSYFDSVYLS
jgi:hypothetical protein